MRRELLYLAVACLGDEVIRRANEAAQILKRKMDNGGAVVRAHAEANVLVGFSSEEADHFEKPARRAGQARSPRERKRPAAWMDGGVHGESSRRRRSRVPGLAMATARAAQCRVTFYDCFEMFADGLLRNGKTVRDLHLRQRMTETQ